MPAKKDRRMVMADAENKSKRIISQWVWLAKEIQKTKGSETEAMLFLQIKLKDGGSATNSHA